MTKEEVIARLKALHNGDPEESHTEGDRILCDLLVSLGYKEVVEEWKKIDKWYA